MTFKQAWTAEDNQRLARLRQSRYTLPQCAAVLGRSHVQTASQWQRILRGRKTRFTCPTEHRVWYEKMRREFGRAIARHELAKALAAVSA